jgi:hypothetical protein
LSDLDANRVLLAINDYWDEIDAALGDEEPRNQIVAIQDVVEKVASDYRYAMDSASGMDGERAMASAVARSIVPQFTITFVEVASKLIAMDALRGQLLVEAFRWRRARYPDAVADVVEQFPQWHTRDSVFGGDIALAREQGKVVAVCTCDEQLRELRHSVEASAR